MNQNPPWFPPAGSTASLNPPSNAQRAQQGIPWYREQVLYPTPWFPKGQNIGLQLRIRPLSVVNQAANVDVLQTIQFDIPTSVYAISAAAIDTTGAALPAGLDPLDTFSIQFQHTNGDLYMTLPALGSTVTSGGGEVTLLGGPAWAQDRGTSILVTVQPLRANLRIDIVLWGIEARGPANYSWPSTGR